MQVLRSLPALALLALAACRTVPIDEGDRTPPTVTFEVLGADGEYHPATNAVYANNTTGYLKLRAVVRDPEGVRQNDTRFEALVSNVYCQGETEPNGPFEVVGLPGPFVETASGSGGKAPTRCSVYVTLDGIYRAEANGQSLSTLCHPADGETIELRCTGTNWASDPAARTTTDTFTIEIDV